MTEAAAPQETYGDFSSIVLTLDHLAATDHPQGHQVHKFVASTQTLNESLVGLLNYYGLQGLLTQQSTIDILVEAASPKGLPIFVLHTLQNTQVVADADTWAVLAAQFGKSMLGATEGLIVMVTQQLRTQEERQGAASTLSLLMLSAQDPDPVEGPQQAAPAAKTRRRQKAKA